MVHPLQQQELQITAAERAKLTPAEQMVAHVNRTVHMPEAHVAYLQKLKASGFEPRVAYDIGAAALHWTSEVKKLWPKCKMVLFDAHAPAAFLYKEHKHYIGVLSDVDYSPRKFYQNDNFFGGNSYYREVGSAMADTLFPERDGVVH